METLLNKNTQQVLAFYRLPISGMKEFKSLKEIDIELEKIGYKRYSGKLEKYICPGYTVPPEGGDFLLNLRFFEYVGGGIQEADTGISFSHYKDARRDENYKKLMELRRIAFAFVNGAIFTL